MTNAQGGASNEQGLDIGHWATKSPPGLYAWTGNLVVGSEYQTVNTGVLDTSQYHHIAIVQSGSTLTMYRDNLVVSTTSAAYGTERSPNYNLRIGMGNLTTTSYPLNGKLSDIRIYNRALTSTEVKALYSEGGWTVTKTMQAFTTVGTTTWTVPAGVTSVEVLVVGGGGGGGSSTSGVVYGSGGGGGGIAYTAAYTTIPGAAVNITVGNGGNATTFRPQDGGTGGNSSFGSLSANGGTGGSAAGAGGNCGSGGFVGGARNGFNGGGGAGAAENGYGGSSEKGGDGLNYSAQFGTSYGENGWFGGGGGGQGYASSLSGGLGGGGYGGDGVHNINARANSGGGGGGDVDISGAGGSGIVLIKY